MNAPLICNQGEVKKIEGSILFVEIERHAACAGCQSKHVCFGSERRNELIEVLTPDSREFQIGEKVEVSIRKSLGVKAILIAYLLPFLILAISLFTSYYFTKKELLSIGIAFILTALYYLLIKIIDKKLQKQFTFTVNKL